MITMRSKCLLLAVLLVFCLHGIASAQEDNSGTNPINFTYDTRFYIEMADLPYMKGSSITNTYEFRAPLGRTLSNLKGGDFGIFSDLGNKYAIRLKFRHQSLNIEDASKAFANAHVSGMGDLDARLLAVPYVGEKFVLGAGVEAYFPTATNDALGTGRYALVPTVFFGFFGVLGEKSIIAPGYLYVGDIGGTDGRTKVNQHKIDMYFVWLLAGMKNWLIINPQASFDAANDKDMVLVDGEFGFMLPTVPGASTYLRPGVGIGRDRPFNWTFEWGLKFIWR